MYYSTNVHYICALNKCKLTYSTTMQVESGKVWTILGYVLDAMICQLKLKSTVVLIYLYWTHNILYFPKLYMYMSYFCHFLSYDMYGTMYKFKQTA